MKRGACAFQVQELRKARGERNEEVGKQMTLQLRKRLRTRKVQLLVKDPLSDLSNYYDYCHPHRHIIVVVIIIIHYHRQHYHRQ